MESIPIGGAKCMGEGLERYIWILFIQLENMTVLWMVCQGIQFYCHFQKNYYNGEVQVSQITSEVSNPTVSTLFKQGTIVTVNATDTDFAD